MHNTRHWTRRTRAARCSRLALKTSARAKTAGPNTATPLSAMRSAAKLPARSCSVISPAAR
eukprot:10178812-Lingulodinium_polyedra.AAC.1